MKKFILGIGIFVVLLLSACFTDPVPEVGTTGVISGIVKDKNNKNPIDSAKVTILNNERNYKYTDENGKFTFINIESGNYTFVITKSNYVDLTEKQVSINANDTINRDFFMTQESEEVVKKMTLSTTSINFDKVIVNTNSTKSFTIKNEGNTIMTITDIEFSDCFSTTSSTSFNLDPNKTRPINVVFTPSSINYKSGTIKIISDKTAGNSNVSVYGYGKIHYELEFELAKSPLYSGGYVYYYKYRGVIRGESSGGYIKVTDKYDGKMYSNNHSVNDEMRAITLGTDLSKINGIEAELISSNGTVILSTGWLSNGWVEYGYDYKKEKDVYQ